MRIPAICTPTVLTLASLAAPASAQLVVAHRGASYDAPENTLAAFKLAWELGSDGIEGDFYLTADNEIVCIHDKTTRRTTGVELTVEASTLDQLRRLDAGSWKGDSWKGERIPTFREVLETVPPGRLFVIELKSKSAIVPVLAEQLRTGDTTDRKLLIISFDVETVRTCKRLIPNVPVHWLTGFERETPDSVYRPTADEVARTAVACDADGVGFQAMTEVVDRNFVEVLKQAGCEQYHVWTVNRAADAKYFQALGVFGITTNRPELIRQALTSQ